MNSTWYAFSQWFDDDLQWFLLTVVYQFELLVLPLVALLLLWPKSWWAPLRFILAVVVIVYLLLFRMHH